MTYRDKIEEWVTRETYETLTGLKTAIEIIGLAVLIIISGFILFLIYDWWQQRKQGNISF